MCIRQINNIRRETMFTSFKTDLYQEMNGALEDITACVKALVIQLRTSHLGKRSKPFKEMFQKGTCHYQRSSINALFLNSSTSVTTKQNFKFLPQNCMVQ